MAAAQASKMEARFAALEQRLLKDQEEKHAALVELLVKLHSPEDDGEVAKLRQIVEDRLIPGLERVEGGQQGSQDAVQRLDLLMRGENEANKLIDGIVPGVEKVYKMVEKLDKKLEKETDRLKKDISYVYDDTKSTNRSMSDIMDLVKKNKRMLEKLEERSDKRRSTTSRRRRTKSGDSDSSRSGSRRRSRSNSSRRRGTASATPSKKEQEVGAMLEQINGSLGLQREMLERQNAKTVMEKEVMPSLERLTKMVEMQGARLKLVEAKEASNRGPVRDPLLPAASKWERGSGDDTPSPPRTASAARAGVGEAPAIGESFSDRRPREKKKKVEKKKRRARSGSSSSSSSSEERGVKDRDKYKDMMDIMVTAVKSVEEKVKELSKTTKRSQQKVESDCKFVMDRVGEMTMGVQVIAENLDSVNDVAKKIEVLDSIQTGLAKLGNLETLVSKVQESANSVTSDLPLVPTTKQSSLSLPHGNLGNLPLPPGSLPLAPPPLRPPPMMPEGDWEEREDRGMSNVNLDNLVHEVVNKVDRKLCEFGSMVEGNLDRLERELKMDESQPPWSKIKALTEITKALSGNSLKVLELVRKIEKRGEGEGGQPASNDRLTELGDRVGEVLPKLDDIYIRVLPALEDIKQRARKESERENLTLKEVREQAEKVEKIMDMVEDLKEGGMGKSGMQSMESGIKASLAEDGVICLLEKIEEALLVQQGLVKQNANSMAEMRTFTAKQTSLDKLERLIRTENRDGEDGEGQGKVDRHLGRILEFLKKEEKTLDLLMKNSMSDAKALSSCNTSIQGMKVAVSGNGKEVVAAVQQVAESVKVVEESLRQVSRDVGGLGGSLDEIGSQVRALEKEGGVCSGLEGLAKLQSSVERMSSKVSGLSSGGMVVQAAKKEGGKEMVVKEVADLRTDGRLDLIHELLVQHGERFETFSVGLAAVDGDLKKHDKNIGHAVRTLVGLLKASVDNTKKNSTDLERLDKLVKREISSVIEKIDLSSDIMKTTLSEAIAEKGEGEKDKTDVEVVTKMETVGLRLETVVSKMDKLNKTVSRIKYLVEDDGSDEEGEGGRRSKKRKNDAAKSDPYEFPSAPPTVDLKPLERRLEEMSAKLGNRDLGDRKGEEMGAKLQAMEDSIVRRLEEELERSGRIASETSSTIANVSNIVKEIGDRMVTKRSWESLQDKLMEIRENLARVPDEFGSQAAALEENLCVNVQGSVREVINHAMEELMTEMDGMNGKLGYIKRYVRFGGKEVDDVGENEPGNVGLDNLMEQITGVAARLADMQAALEVEATEGQEENSGRAGARERLGTALLLTEIRKKADSESVQKLSQEMYKSIHTVQRRLLEEQARLVSRLGEGRGESPPPAFMGIVEALNKVRECQVTIQSNQDLAISLQTHTNRLLGSAVERLEETAQFAGDGGAAGNDLEAGRLSTLCDALAESLTSLMAAQDEMGRRDGEHVEALDRLVRSTTTMVAAQETTRSPRSLAVAHEGRSPSGRKRGADLLARGDTSPSSSLVKKGRRGGDSRRSPATEEDDEEKEVEAIVKEEEDQEMEGDGRGESQEESTAVLQQRSNTKVRQPSVRVERQSLSARQRQQLAKDSNVQPQLNLQDEFASPEKVPEEEEQRR